MISMISCSSPGDCGAVGTSPTRARRQAFRHQPGPRPMGQAGPDPEHDPDPQAGGIARRHRLLLGRQLRPGRVLHRRGRPFAGVHRQPEGRHLAQGLLGSRPGQAGSGPQRRARLPVLSLGRELHRLRLLHRRVQGQPPVRRDRGPRRLGPGQAGAAPQRPAGSGAQARRSGSGRSRASRPATAPPAVSYSISGGGSTGFVDDEVNGVWGTPQAVPGLAALNVGLQAADHRDLVFLTGQLRRRRQLHRIRRATTTRSCSTKPTARGARPPR